jgi:hypothetical protein
MSLVKLMFNFEGFFKAYEINWRLRTETISQILNLLSVYWYFTGDLLYTVRGLEVVIFIRMLRILSLLMENKTFTIIIQTMQGLLGPFYTLLLVQFTVFYVFNVSAMRLFGGLIKTTAPAIINNASVPDSYVLDNFNDFFSGLITLFELMVVNNWQVNVGMYTAVTGTNWTRVFFVFFYYFSVVIGLNIVVAFAIDMYTSIERLHN